MLKSKSILDPTSKTYLKWGAGNNAGLTVGFTFYTPKYSKCKPEQYFASQLDHARWPKPLSEEELEQRFMYWYFHKYVCKKKRHMNYVGYVYWTGPKRRYTFRYMGPTWSNEKWWKPFSVYKHNRYVRWFDNGPQNKPDPVNLIRRDRAALDTHYAEFRQALESSRQQMAEYVRVRGYEL